MSHLQITQDARGVALTSRDSDLFLPGSAVLSSNSGPYLNKVAELLKDRPHRKVLIDSISENAGSAELNQELQEVRSLTLMKALTNRGIDKSRLAYTQPNAYNGQTGTNAGNQYKTKIIILGESTSEMNVSTIERFFDDLYKYGNNIFN
ncbi:OmpA family protein [Advenella sp. RU8]|uniref:OmpA family protein n=1 Tax=Advenella sp. RU8 TaxID=3399575 RepID=UPI003AAD1E15